MNTLIHDRLITAADVLKEREVRAKVLYSPCQDADIKWKYCPCFVCRAIWDPTGEEDAARANAAREAQAEEQAREAPVAKPVENPHIPTCLPPPKDSDKTVTLTGAEVNTTVRLLGKYEVLLERCIQKMMGHLEEKSRNSDYLPVPPPELDELFATKTYVMNLIHDLQEKPMV